MQVLILANGAYGKRMEKICHIIDIPVDVFEFSEDGIVDVSQVMSI
jgi:aspartate aminotransferase-like enzyme